MAQRAPDTRCSPVVEVSQIKINKVNTSMVYIHMITPVYAENGGYSSASAHAMGSLHYPACISGSESVRSTPSAERPLLHGIAAWPLFKLQSQEIPRSSSLPISSKICIHSNSIHKTYKTASTWLEIPLEIS